MTNENIIYNAAVTAGLFTPEEAQAIVASGRTLPIHTYAEWKALGFQVKAGAHAAIEVLLWKRGSRKVQKTDGTDEDAQIMFRCPAYLFVESQVELITEHHAKSADEIRAYNAMLAAQRKARSLQIA